MRVEKINGEYQFISVTNDGAFLVILTLKAGGEEQLNTVSAASPVSFRPRKLKKGAIRTAIGEERWANFLKMKKARLSSMFIDPQQKNLIPHTF